MTSTETLQICDAVESVLPRHRPIHHHTPKLHPWQFDNFKKFIKSGFDGTCQESLTGFLQGYCGVNQAVPTCSGTGALATLLWSFNIHEDHEVLVPSMTFAATMHAVTGIGATPHFIDGFVTVSPTKLDDYLSANTYMHKDGQCINKDTRRAIRALIVVDLFGFPADYEKLEIIAHKFNLLLIEDAAQALGASYNGKKCGSFGDGAIVSFNNNKIVTGNGGGAVLTKFDTIAVDVRNFSNQCRVKHPWLVESFNFGVNHRMSDMSAEMILSQMYDLQITLDSKEKLFNKYKEALKDTAASMLEMKDKQKYKGNYWLSTMLVPEYLRDEVFENLHTRGILARAAFTPLHTLSYIQGNFPMMGDMIFSESLHKQAVCLPSGGDVL